MGKSITELSSVTGVGLDLAKNAFQVRGVDTKGEVVGITGTVYQFPDSP